MQLTFISKPKLKHSSLNECCIFSCVKMFEINDTSEYLFVTEACNHMAALLTIKKSNMQKINVNLTKERERERERRERERERERHRKKHVNIINYQVNFIIR